MDKTVQYVWSEYRNWALTSRNVKARLEKAGAVVLLLTSSERLPVRYHRCYLT